MELNITEFFNTANAFAYSASCAEIVTYYLNEHTSVVGEVGDEEIIFACF